MQRAASSRLRWRFAKIRPRDIDELTLKACLSGVYDKVQLAYGSKAVIGYSVALDLVSRRTAAA